MEENQPDMTTLLTPTSTINPVDAPPSMDHTPLSSAESSRVGNRRTRRRRNLESLAMFALMIIGVVMIAMVSDGHGSVYGFAAIGLLALKLLGSALYRPRSAAIPEGLTAAVVVPTYNEDPVAFRACLDSVLEQTRPADEIWVIDDGSATDDCLDIAHDLLAGRPGGFVHKLPANAGKRYAQGYAFSRTTADIIVTVDSDTVLDRAAIAEGLRGFADPGVQAVTANVRALNQRKNLLTRLIDLRYANAFLFERAAYSTVGSVVCCCGSLSFFRAETVQAHLDDFLNQTFLGVPVQYGDDRRMTQYALTRGKVLVQDTCVAYTAVPERIGHFARQQVRWNKSFFRESLWAVRRLGVRHPAFWISLAEVLTWFAFSSSLLYLLYLRPAFGGPILPWYYVAYAAVLAYARNVRYFGRPNMSATSQWITFALAPLYAALHVALLTPLRLWALLTLRQPGWGTRSGVEVTIDATTAREFASS